MIFGEGHHPPEVIWTLTNHLSLIVGRCGSRDISFWGCLDGRDVVIGCGPLASEEASDRLQRVHLRLERTGKDVRALCSADGTAWRSAGEVAFPIEDPLQVGVVAIGTIDRTIYHGAYPEGTAIRFESFQMWQKG